jgi:hypothetical protein
MYASMRSVYRITRGANGTSAARRAIADGFGAVVSRRYGDGVRAED